ncbi:RecT family recombinase [Roseovarius indicus]|uniref:RecT family recombinase n=1 Tax=Roseovarius indicus TaxID=540747 RepID=UPI0032EAE966
MTEQNETETAVAAAKPQTPMQAISATLDTEDMTDRLAASLDGTGVSASRFKRAALTALAQNDYVVKSCSRGPIYSALMNAASAGLELHPALGQAYLVPRKGQAVLQVGYKGLIALAQRHPSIAAVDAGVIREGDEYELIEGTHPELRIKRSLTPGGWIAAYCVTHYSGGVAVPTIMTKEQIETHRDKHSDAYKRGGAGAKVWKDRPEEMAKKTVLRKAAKMWPVSIPGGNEAEVIGQDDAPQAPPMRDVTPGPGGHLDALSEAL